MLKNIYIMPVLIAIFCKNSTKVSANSLNKASCRMILFIRQINLAMLFILYGGVFT